MTKYKRVCYNDITHYADMCVDGVGDNPYKKFCKDPIKAARRYGVPCRKVTSCGSDLSLETDEHTDTYDNVPGPERRKSIPRTFSESASNTEADFPYPKPKSENP